MLALKRHVSEPHSNPPRTRYVFRRGRPRRPIRRKKWWRRKPKAFNVKRQIVSDIDLTNGALAGFPAAFNVNTADGGARLNFSANMTLEQIPGYTEFTGLFQLYRILAIKCQFVPYTSQTVISSVDNVTPNFLMYTKTNHSGTDETGLTEADWAQITRKKTRILGPRSRSIGVYCKMKQSNQVWSSDGLLNPEFSLQYPQWCSVNEPKTMHYGLTCSLATVDNGTLAGLQASLVKYKMITTVYLQLRYVK